MANKRIAQLYAKKLAGEATEAELEELKIYLQANSSEQYFQDIFTNWWQSNNDNVVDVDTEKEAHFKFIVQQAANEDSVLPVDEIVINTPVVHIRRNQFWKRMIVAAAIASILFFSTWKFFTHNPIQAIASTQENEIVARRGTKSKLLLSDGTKVWLNSDSRLLYNNAFNGHVREVTLEGEAYFDVVKDPKRPFIVHTSGINIKVLGTAFNVKAYPQDMTIEATLVRGLIEVEKNSQPQSSKIILHPNEKLVYNKIQEKSVGTNEEKQSGNLVIASSAISIPQSISISTLPKNTIDSTRLETSWVYGKLLFDGDTFKELAPKLERWFNVKIAFKNTKVANYRFSGVFENENIEEAIKALQLTAPFKFVITGNEVMIDKK